MIKIENLNKKFGKKKILQDINLSLDKGVYALLGPNGAGKTTFIRMLLGLYPSKKGVITFEDKYTFGYLSQKFGVYGELTVYEAIEYIAMLKNVKVDNLEKAIEAAIETVNLTSDTNTKIRKLSGGMMRRVGLASAIIGDAQVLIFDEPTAGLDPEERINFRRIINTLSKDRIIIISTHILSDVEDLAEKFIVINKGNLIFLGDNKSLKENAEGKVFITDKITADDYVIAEETVDDIKQFRIISKSDNDLVPVKANLEDGYLCLLHEF